MILDTGASVSLAQRPWLNQYLKEFDLKVKDMVSLMVEVVALHEEQQLIHLARMADEATSIEEQPEEDMQFEHLSEDLSETLSLDGYSAPSVSSFASFVDRIKPPSVRTRSNSEAPSSVSLASLYQFISKDEIIT